MALLLPMALISRCVPPMPGMTPRLTSGCTANIHLTMTTSFTRHHRAKRLLLIAHS